MGADPGETAALLDAVRPRTVKPLILKLTPNTAAPADVAAAAEAHGADAVSLINTLRGMALDPDVTSQRGSGAWLGGGTGGVSGPAVRAIALVQVHEVRARIRLPIVGMGGVQRGRHAADLLRAGADLRSEEHTSELQSRQYLVCRLLLEKKTTSYLSSSSSYPCAVSIITSLVTLTPPPRPSPPHSSAYDRFPVLSCRTDTSSQLIPTPPD